VSDEKPFADLIARRVVDVAPITGHTGKQYGLVLNVSGYLLALYANADEHAYGCWPEPRILPDPVSRYH
jgi:hypothetical protein